MMLHIMMLVLLSVTLVPLPEKNVTPAEIITVDLINFMPEKTVAPSIQKEKITQKMILPKLVAPKPTPIVQKKAVTPPKPQKVTTVRKPVIHPVAKFVPIDKKATEYHKSTHQTVKKSVEKTVDNFAMGQTFPQKTVASTPNQMPSVPVVQNASSAVQTSPSSPHTPSLPKSATAPKSVHPNVYIAGIRQIIANYKAYPKMARKRGVEGVNTVRITLNHLGKVVAVHIVKSAGSEMLDQAATDAVRQAQSSLPPFPKDLMQTSLTFDLSFQFSIS